MCDFVDNRSGVPCMHTGVVAINSTTGSGPWYCREHAEIVQDRRPYGVGNALPPRPRRPEREWEWCSI